MGLVGPSWAELAHHARYVVCSTTAWGATIKLIRTDCRFVCGDQSAAPTSGRKKKIRYIKAAQRLRARETAYSELHR
jgi:hypothetical protein